MSKSVWESMPSLGESIYDQNHKNISKMVSMDSATIMLYDMLKIYPERYISITITSRKVVFELLGLNTINQWNHNNFQQLIIVEKSEMAASKMAAWCSRLLHVSHYPT